MYIHSFGAVRLCSVYNNYPGVPKSRHFGWKLASLRKENVGFPMDSSQTVPKFQSIRSIEKNAIDPSGRKRRKCLHTTWNKTCLDINVTTEILCSVRLCLRAIETMQTFFHYTQTFEIEKKSSGNYPTCLFSII